MASGIRPTRNISSLPASVGSQIQALRELSAPRMRRRLPNQSPIKLKALSAGPRLRSNPHQVKAEVSEQDVKFFNIPSERETLKKHSDNRKFNSINPDDILERCQETDVNRVYDIDVHALELNQISHLEKFIKVRILDLSCNFISKIENLDHNQDIRELKLYDNSIAEISHLDPLKELSVLQLQHNEIKNIGRGLSTCKKLKVLRLDCNRLFKIDVKELASCSNLTSIDISNNRLDSLTALNCLPNLEELLAVNNRLRVITDLSRCKKLQEVDVSYNKIVDLSGLKGLAHLQTLHASHNQMMSMKTLAKLKCLLELNVSHNRITELKSLFDFYPALEILDISENHVETWQQVTLVKLLRGLVELYISGNPFCSERGPKPHYFSELQELLPQLDILDGAHTKKQVQLCNPLMRPMSASTVVSSRQVESQLTNITNDVDSFERDFSAQFESLRSAYNTLPTESPSTSNRSFLPPSSIRPSSKAGKRSRIQEALQYADRFDLNPEVMDGGR